MKTLTTASPWLGWIVLIAAGSQPSLKAENLLAVGYGEGLPGSGGVAVAVTARHDIPIHGFSLALAYPRQALSLIDINLQGTTTEQVGVDFYQQVLDNSTGTGILGVIFSFNEPFEPLALPPTAPNEPPQLLAWLFFDVPRSASPGLHRIELLDHLGDPPVSNRFTHQGATIRPNILQGSFMVYSENVLTLDSRFTFPGFRAEPVFAYARHPQPMQGFQMAVSFDPRALTLEEATVNGTSMVQLLGGLQKIEFIQINWMPQDIEISETEYRATTGVIFDYTPPYNDLQVLPVETSSTTKQSIMKYSFQPTVNADQYGESIPLTLSDSSTPGAINNVFIIDGKSHVPQKVHGRIYFSTGNLTGIVASYQGGQPISGATLILEPGDYRTFTKADGSFLFEEIPPGPYSALVTKGGYYPARVHTDVAGKGATTDMGTILLFAKSQGEGFRRGMINSDDKTDLSDVIALLNILFLGQQAPECDDAMDVNDDSDMDISDPIYFLDYMFTGGKSPPPPFVNCGSDPTPDELGCVMFLLCD